LINDLKQVLNSNKFFFFMNKKESRKFFLSLLFSASVFCGKAQSDIITKYYDSLWNECSKDTAVYFAEFKKDDIGYDCSSYSLQSGRIHCTSTFVDTNFTTPIGVQKCYYENGVLEDSTYYNTNGNIEQAYHYFENGRLSYHAFYDKKDDDVKGENYDSTGKKMPGYFTFQKEARYPEGANGWREYLSTNLKSNFPIKKRAPPRIYTVVVAFIVNTDGKVTEKL